MTNVICELIVDRRKTRKWMVASVPDVRDAELVGKTVSIGLKYADKLKYNIGDTVLLDRAQLFDHPAGYLFYNSKLVSKAPETMVSTTNPISLKDDGFYLDDYIYRVMSRNIKRQVNTLILGPTGCGNKFVC